MTDMEFIVMSIALCDIIPLMEPIKEMRECIFDIVNTQPNVYARSLRTSLVQWNSQGFHDYTHIPSISTYVTITFLNMSGRT